jgi:hypothetical protein
MPLRIRSAHLVSVCVLSNSEGTTPRTVYPHSFLSFSRRLCRGWNASQDPQRLRTNSSRVGQTRVACKRNSLDFYLPGCTCCNQMQTRFCRTNRPQCHITYRLDRATRFKVHNTIPSLNLRNWIGSVLVLLPAWYRLRLRYAAPATWISHVPQLRYRYCTV